MVNFNANKKLRLSLFHSFNNFDVQEKWPKHVVFEKFTKFWF